jgi:hypothetical protein
MDSFILHISLADNTTTDSRWFIVAGVMLVVIWVLMKPRKGKDPLQQSGPRMSLAQQKNVERQMETLLVEFAEMARKISAQLDTRSAKLELLIKEADEKLAALGAQTGAGNAAENEPLVHAEVQTPVTATAGDAGPPPPQHADVYQLADQGRSPLEIAKQLNRPSGEVELILALRPKEQTE